MNLFFWGWVETESPCVAQAVALCTPGWHRTQKLACLCLPGAGIEGVPTSSWHVITVFKETVTSCCIIQLGPELSAQAILLPQPPV